MQKINLLKSNHVQQLWKLQIILWLHKIHFNKVIKDHQQMVFMEQQVQQVLFLIMDY